MDPGTATFVALAAAVVAALAVAWTSAPPAHAPANALLLGPGCKMARETDLSCEDFVQRFLGREPVVLRNVMVRDNADFLAATAPQALRDLHGGLPVKLSTANSFTGRSWTETDLATYMDTLLRPQDEQLAGNQTFYLFGSQQGAAWADFLSAYRRPTLVYPSESFEGSSAAPASGARDPLCQGLRVENKLAALSARQDQLTSLSFGLAGAGTGVPFHFHGPGFLQMLHGRKRWFLYPPGTSPNFHPNATTLSWVQTVYPSLSAHEKPSHECVLEPGDVIYFPSGWMHATLNLDNYTAFIATFA